MNTLSSFSKNYIICFTLLIIGLSGYTQQDWKWQNPTTTGVDFFGVSMVNVDVFVAVGSFGIVTKTTARGSGFAHTPLENESQIQSAAFMSLTTGIVVGADGMIFRTTDCGETWSDQSPPAVPDTLNGVVFPNGLVGYAVGDDGRVLKTTNGGLTWTIQNSGTSNNLNAVSFSTIKSGFAVGDSGTIIFTNNGGFIWQDVNAGSILDGKTLRAAYTDKFDTTGAIIVGECGTNIKTTDSGTTWTHNPKPTGGMLNGAVCIEDTLPGATYIAVGDSGGIFYSPNGGSTWTKKPLVPPIDMRLIGISYVDSVVVTVGEKGHIYISEDFGVTWSMVFAGSCGDLGCMASTPIQLTSLNLVGGPVDLLRSSNGGEEWVEIAAIDAPSGNIEALEFVPGSGGSDALSVGGDFGDSARIHMSNDSGKTWTEVPSPGPNKLFGITMYDALQGTAVGKDGIIVGTTNGGASWDTKTSPSSDWLLDIDSRPSGIAYAVGGNGTILKTTNFGNAWSQQTSTTTNWLESVAFIDDQKGMAVGNSGKILFTDNGGTTWQDKSVSASYELTHISFGDQSGVANKNSASSHCYATVVGFNGLILTTKDCGDNWTKEISRTDQNLWGVFFTDSLTGWAVGEGGTILHTDLKDTLVSIDPILNQNLTTYSLGQNYPNPFSDHTSFEFQIPAKSHVRIVLSNISGEEVQVLVDKQLIKGTYRNTWTQNNLSSGIYFYQMTAGDYTESRKLIIRN